MVYVSLVTVVVQDYDQAIGFFTGALGFELAEDSPAVTSDGRPRRWVVVRPPGAGTGLLLAQADGQAQAAVAGRQAAGRVGFFLRVTDFDAAYARMSAAGVTFVTAPRPESYGRVAVFLDSQATDGISSGHPDARRRSPRHRQRHSKPLTARPAPK